MIDLKVRPKVQGGLGVLGQGLAKLGVTPTMVTVAGLVVALAGSVLVGTGRFVVGGIVFLVGSSLDGLDGSVARASNSASARGAFLDATVDRLGEIGVLTAIGLAQREESWLVLLLAPIAMAGGLMIPYLRAKAEAEGLDGRVGLMGRAERVILVSAGLIAGVIEPMLWVLAVLSWVTVGQRFFATYFSIDR